MGNKTTGGIEENIQQLKRYQCFEISMSCFLGGWLPGLIR